MALQPRPPKAHCLPPAGRAQLGEPSSLSLPIFPRFLLTAVALLSSYSIHLLLKSSGIVGEPQAGLQQGRAHWEGGWLS